MTLEEQLDGPSKRLLQFTGRPVTLINRVVETDADGNPVRDEYGDPSFTTQEHETKAEFEFPGSPQFDIRGGGDTVDVDVLVFIPVDVGDGAYPEAPGGVPDAVFDGNESDEYAPTRVYDQRNDETYTVREYFDENNGRARLHAVA